VATIFISHSAKDPEGERYLRAIADGLSGAGHDVWVDFRRLQGGDNWGFVIANEMAECHGAVALFSATALASEYFRFEVSNLFARWMREGPHAKNAGFRFTPVVVPPLTVDALKANPFVAAAYFGIVDWIVPDTTATAIDAVKRTFGGLIGWPSPLQAVEAQVEAILAPIGKPAVYLDAAREAGFGPDDMRGANPAALLARLYMRCSIERLCASLRRLENVLGEDPVQRLFDLLAPSWVSFEAGCQFDAYLCLSSQTPVSRFAVLTGERVDFTPLMYLMRARRANRSVSHLVPVMPPDVGALSEASLLREVETGLADYVVRHFAASRSAAVAKELSRMTAALDAGDRAEFERLLRTFIERLVLGGGAVLVAVPAGPADFALIESVSAKPFLGRVTFVALRGHQHPPPRRIDNVIVPELSPGYEDLAYNAFVGFTGG
jgi:hypothetical protein